MAELRWRELLNELSGQATSSMAETEREEFPQGLKPIAHRSSNVGPKGPTP
jgi:hypothetical protein